MDLEVGLSCTSVEHRLQRHGGAAAEWPELKSGRCLVEFFLVWKTSSANLERRFGRFSEIHCAQRARLFDTTVESCMAVEQAPICQTAAHEGQGRADRRSIRAARPEAAPRTSWGHQAPAGSAQGAPGQGKQAQVPRRQGRPPVRGGVWSEATGGRGRACGCISQQTGADDG